MDWNKVLTGAVSGWVAAAAIDFEAFRSWQRVEDALTYSWKIAVFRWIKGAILGALGGLSL